MNDAGNLLTGLLAASAFLLAAGAVWVALRGLGARNLERRVMGAAAGTLPEPQDDGPALGWAARLLRWIGEAVRGRTHVYSERDILALEGMIAASGLSPQRILPVILGIKVVAAVATPAAAFLYARVLGAPVAREVLYVCIAAPIGLLGPEWLLAFLRRPYLAALRNGVPDALDLLVVCSEAGMGLESALERVSQEMRHSNAAVAEALSRLLDEIRILPDRRDAFRNFANRTGVDGARRLATMMGQSLQYGTPLSQALRTVAVDLRRERMLKLEAKAVRLPVLLVLPLILCIMPSLFIILTGPAVLRLIDALHAAVLHH